MHECETPHLQSDDIQPSFHCMEEHCTGSWCDDTNVAFNHSVLPMRLLHRMIDAGQKHQRGPKKPWLQRHQHCHCGYA
jgi:hypothetical protein